MEEAKSKAEEGIEERILRAMRARVSDFKEQANSITLENVRRTLEKDLEMDAFTLDAHKRFIKQTLDECFHNAEEVNMSKDSAIKLESSVQPENQKQSGNSQECNEETEGASGLDEKIKGTETAGDDTNAQETDEAPYINLEVNLNEDLIKKAIKKRASYFRANSEEISLVGVRRLLEEDLKLEKKTLDVYKKFINTQLDEILQSPEVVKPTSVRKKHTAKGTPGTKTKGPVGVGRTEDSEKSSGSGVPRSEDEEIDEHHAKSKKRSLQKVRNNGLAKRQKRSTESKSSSSVKKKHAERAEKTAEIEDVGNSSEDACSPSSDEESVKKKWETPAQAYGKRVEHLKSIIKSCGMGVPPSVYKRVKQVPEIKRESYLIKELQDILIKEGLSTNPSEKDIKAVRKKKERAKELEGIDLSNIVSSTRRRTTSSFVVPPKPEVLAESDEDDEEEEEDDEDSDDGNTDSGVSSEENDEDGDEESG